MASDERAELKGVVLDRRYRIGDCIGVGGTGVVFEATRLRDGRQVVVKTLRPTFAFDADLVRRLKREAEVARVVGHPGIVPVTDKGLLPEGSPYLVMERAAGESLTGILCRRGALTPNEVAIIAIRTAAVLHLVHQNGYVHRDVKPEHILLDRTSDGRLRVRLLDFGVCAAETAPPDERERERGRVFGTPSYVSPEQAMGYPYVDARADVFGLGVVMFEMLTGRLPFTSRNVPSLLRRIIREDAPRAGLCVPAVGTDLDEIVARALARDVQERHPSMRALARALAPHAARRIATERKMAAELRLGRQDEDTVETMRDAIAAA